MTITKNLLDNCFKIAEKLSDPNKVDFSYEKIKGWNPLSLSHGYPGLIMLFAELDRFFPRKKWDYVTHEYMIQLKCLIEEKVENDVSLFSGFSGINYAVRLASKNGSRYTSIIEKLDMHLYNLGSNFLNNVKKTHECLVYGASEFGFDLVSGITGIGAYALKSENEHLQSLLKEILVHLIELSADKEIDGKQVSSFLSSPETFIMEEDKVKYPFGYLNLGMAHGITGPLALLSLSRIHGVTVNGQLEAINKLSEDLSRLMSNDKNGLFVPRMVSLEDVENDSKTRKSESRFDAWCYGGLGVTRALSLAYEATGKKEIKDQTLSLLRGLLTCSVEEWNIHTPILCHGYAGNLQVVNRLLESDVIVGCEEVKNALDEVRNKLFIHIEKQYDCTYEYGFTDILNRDNKTEEKVGFLEGVAGIILAVISSQTKEPAKWDGVLLLS